MILPAETMFRRARAYCRALLFCIVAGTLLAAAPAQAGRGGQRHQERDGAAAQQGRNDADGAARAAAIVARNYGGTVLKVSRQGTAYSVRVLLPDGTVKNVTVDAGD